MGPAPTQSSSTAESHGQLEMPLVEGMALVVLGPEQVSTLVFRGGKSQSLALALAQLRTLSYGPMLEQEEGSSTAPTLP